MKIFRKIANELKLPILLAVGGVFYAKIKETNAHISQINSIRTILNTTFENKNIFKECANTIYIQNDSSESPFYFTPPTTGSEPDDTPEEDPDNKESNEEEVSESRRLTDEGNEIRWKDFVTAEDYAEAEKRYIKALELAENDEDRIHALANYGTSWNKQGEYEKALEKWIEELRLTQKNPELNPTDLLYNIGHVYKKLDNIEKALKYYTDALAEAKKRLEQYTEDDESEIYILEKNLANCLNSIGGIYLKNYQKPDIANEYFQKALKIFQKLNYKPGINFCINNLGITYLNQGEYIEALKYLNKSLKYQKNQEDNLVISQSFLNIANAHNGLKQYNQTLYNLKKSLEHAEKINDKRLIMDIYTEYYKTYKALGNSEKALEYKELYEEIEDELFDAEKDKNTKEMAEKYENDLHKAENEMQQLELEKKNLKNLSLQKDIKSHELQAQRDKVIQIAIGLGLLLASLMAILQFRSRKLLKKKNEEIEKQKAEIEEQKAKLEHIYNEVMDSIKYAEKIQTAILPNLKELCEKHDLEHCKLFKPKDEVSGDFYWATEKDGRLFISAADSTGHGVPGAFMSMLGTAFLNEITNESPENAADILMQLRYLIIKTLHQTGANMEQKDGMDMGILSIDRERNKVEFAGANNPLYVIRKKSPLPLIITTSGEKNKIKANISSETHDLFEIKPDKMPVAIYEKMDNFNNNEIETKKGDMLFMFSDGYADQFGGEKGKKLKYKPFKRLLLDNANKPMAQVESSLDDYVERWMAHIDPVTDKPFKQIDDIVVLGIRTSSAIVQNTGC